MSLYRVEFDRIGTCHNVPPLVIEAEDADAICDAVNRYATKFMRSYADSGCGLNDDGTGRGNMGFGRFGTFTIKHEAPHD